MKDSPAVSWKWLQLNRQLVVEVITQRYRGYIQAHARDGTQNSLALWRFPSAPRRWVVERTFAWLGRYRRLSKDYEHRSEYSETWVYVASIARMLRTLHPHATAKRPYQRTPIVVAPC